MSFEPDEVYRINKTRLALRLGVLPSLLEAEPVQNVLDLIELSLAEDKLGKADAVSTPGRTE